MAKLLCRFLGQHFAEILEIFLLKMAAMIEWKAEGTNLYQKTGNRNAEKLKKKHNSKIQ